MAKISDACNFQITSDLAERWMSPFPRLSFNNVSLISNSSVAIHIETVANVSITNSTITGTESYFQSDQYLSFQDDLFVQDYGFLQPYGFGPQNGMAMLCKFCHFVAVTDCTTENYNGYFTNTDAVPEREGFGEGQFIELSPYNSEVYFGNNQSLNLGDGDAEGDVVNSNGGEQVLVDAPAYAYANTITGAGNDSAGNGWVTVGNDQSGLSLVYLDIITGGGMGQHFQITGVSAYEGGETTIYLKGPFRVIPVDGDHMSFDDGSSNLVFYDNTLNNRTDSLGSNEQSSSGFNLGDGGYGVVVDDNTVNNCVTGVMLWGNGSVDQHTFAYYGNYSDEFFEILNNQITIPLSSTRDEPTGVSFPTYGYPGGDPDIFGIRIANNSFTQTTVSFGTEGHYIGTPIGIGLPGLYNDGVRNDIPSSPAPGSCIAIQNNIFTDMQIGIATRDEDDTLVYGNTFNAGGSTAGDIAIQYVTGYEGGLLLQNNTYNGYTGGSNKIYSSSIPASILQLPQDIIYLTSDGTHAPTQSLQLEDAGAEKLVVQLTRVSYINTGGWLPSNGPAVVIEGESTVSVSWLDVGFPGGTGLPEGSYWAIATLTYDLVLSRTILINLNVT